MSAFTNFIVQDDAHKEAKPYVWRGEEQPGLPLSNMKDEEKALNLIDVRTLPEAAKPRLDTHGMTFLQHKSKTVADVEKDEQNVGEYVREMEELIRTEMGVNTVIGYNARVCDAGFTLLMHAKCTQATDTCLSSFEARSPSCIMATLWAFKHTST